MRLAKYLAEAGIASRRKAEELIKQKRVKLNGNVVETLGVKIDPEKDKVEVDGKAVNISNDKIYILLNKPAGYISSVYDPQGRPTVVQLIKDIDTRIYPVGRLDFDTEGLLLLTNDGDFTNLMLHPRYEITKTYEAWVKGVVSSEALKKLRKGVLLEDGITAPAKVRIIKRGRNETLLEIKIHEGRKRQVKRMCKAVGYPVLRLKRTGLAFLNLNGLKTGEYRHLHPDEVERLKLMAAGRRC
ncbi:ribosomal large subunit pseudouridine synthase B [Thermosyntropha lipolytica DSM 11003]|uniref:Pseudouridine synthase n=1 Tax=Thermosyntropha lipolytica DSM 11003 TaxID=1123382 RepID=A0A1M5Q943_9FIRM|nr:pseudouridine synthase [Thermosyntropha lipolytica]SHH10289.1 ribosomal large subunit pseudouridine synthase B [Thermosyntropha lipolytica DSM 11003]